jgi:hypothetical protein
MSHDHNFNWRMPDGETLFDFLARFAEEEARSGPRFAEFEATAARNTCEGLLLTQAAFLARYPHYAPRRLPPICNDVFETWRQWESFLAWACQEAGMTHDFAARLRWALRTVGGIDFGGPEIPRTYN